MADLAVTGSTGALGGRVARALADLGVEQRLIVRSAERAPRLDGAEVREVPGGYADPAGFRAALEGVGTLFLVSAEDSTFLLGRDHWATEQAIRETGVAFTFLRDSFYMDFIPYFAGPQRTFRGPAGNGRLAPVSRDDVAAVAVQVLSALGSHDGQAYRLTGPEVFTLTEAAARMSAYTGEPYTYVEETTEEAWASRRPTGAPDWMIEGWISTYVAIADGSLGQVSGDVEAVTGRAPQALEQTLDAHPELLAGDLSG
jgi:NAD(P)H dehydrogenase (quinone)